MMEIAIGKVVTLSSTRTDEFPGPAVKVRRHKSVASIFSAFTWREYFLIILSSSSVGFSYSLVTIGVPVFPQYFRDSGIYKSQIVIMNEVAKNG